MVPNQGANIRDRQFRTFDITTPIDVILTMDALQDNNGFSSATGIYYGGIPYNGGDSQDARVVIVLGRNKHAVQVVSSNTLSYSLSVQGSLDGLNWVTLGSALTTDGITQFTGLYRFLRANLTAWTIVASPNGSLPTGVYVRLVSVQ